VNNPLDLKRIFIFIAFAFGIAWLVGLVVYLTGGLTNSPEIIVPGSGITLGVALVAVGYMWAPALAHLLTRLMTREGWQNTYLRPRRRGWPYWILAWCLPAVMTIVGAAVFFLLFPQYFDPELSMLSAALARSGQNINPWLVVLIQTLSGMLISPLVNGLFTFGEEFGWRAYLQPKLMPLGGRKSVVLLGVIWGMWHWPLTAMGHNYGLDYAGAPWLGMLAMLWMTTGLSAFLGWATLRSGSVWPAVIGHAAVNGISALAALCTLGSPNPLLGPLPVGLIGSAGWAALAIALLVKPGALEAEPVETTPAGAPEQTGEAEDEDLPR
jgi:membrane protease YdiL (CAAX protease family)